MQKSSIYIFVFLLSILILIRYIIGFNGMYGQDSFEYIRYAESLKKYMYTGEHPGDYFWPVGYPILISTISVFTGDIFLAGQLLSLLGMVGILLYSLWFIRFIATDKDQQILYYLFIFMILSPFLLRGALIVMPDVITAFFVLASLFHYLKSTKSGTHHFMWGTLFGALSIMMRYTAIIIWFPAAMAGLYYCLKNKQWMILLLSSLIAVLIFLPHLLIRQEDSFKFMGHSWLTGWSPVNFFKRSFTNPDGFQQNRLYNFIYALGGIFHPGYFLSGLAFLMFIINKKQTSIFYITVISILFYLIFLAGIPYQNYRFILIVVPIAIVLLYPGYQNLVNKWPKIVKFVFIPFIIFFQILSFTYGFKIIYERNQLELKIANYLKNNPTQNIYLFDMDVALKGYKVQTNYYNLWEKEYNIYIPGSSVLFNESKFSTQWKGRNVMNNWEYLKENYSLMEQQDFGDGWILYEIK